MYKLLQISRFLAALWVLFFHLQGQAQQYFEISWGWSTYGNLGVDFFFALSGFVMVMAHYKDAGDRSQLVPYFKKRVIRIYPLIWILASLQVIQMLITKGEGHDDYGWWIRSYLLLPADEEHIVNVAWSLRFEMMFYSVFALSLCIKNRVLFTSLLVVWGALSLMVEYSESNAYIRQFISPMVSIFVAGTLSGYLYQLREITEERKASWLDGLMHLLFITGAVMLFVLDHRPTHSNKSFLVYLMSALCFGSSIYLMCYYEKRYSLNFPRALTLLGDASYAQYLIHSTAIVMCVRLFGKYAFFDSPVTWGLMVIGIIIGSVLTYVYIEVPIMRILRKRFLKPVIKA